jgi:beta-phosphoglucomutase family hydrolase
MLGLPAGVTACLFDLDGVLTQTAKVHAKAWKQMFDEYLKDRAEKEGVPFVPFDAQEDYNSFVDGKPRYDGVRDFLASRGIELSEQEVEALGDRKNELVLAIIRRDGVEAYEGSVRYLKAATEAGLRRAVVSSSTNCASVVAAAGIDGYLEARVDGLVAEERKLNGKPAPDTFLAAAEMLGVEPSAAAVFEDALAGVEAGRAGAFGCVVGVDRVDHAAALKEHGADVVVQDLSELLERP